MNLLHKKGRPYHRLITIFYPKHCETVLNIVRDDGVIGGIPDIPVNCNSKASDESRPKKKLNKVQRDAQSTAPKIATLF